MATIKLTDAIWLDYNKERAKGRLMVVLGSSENKLGLANGELASILKKGGLVFTGPELIALRDALIADGVIIEVA